MKKIILAIVLLMSFSLISNVSAEEATNDEEETVELFSNEEKKNSEESTIEFVFGEETKSITVKNGDKIDPKDIPVAPEKEGYKFIGWQILSDVRSLTFFDVKEDVVKEDLTLNAFYEEVQVKIENFNDKKEESPNTGVEGNNINLYVGIVVAAVLVGGIALFINKRNKK